MYFLTKGNVSIQTATRIICYNDLLMLLPLQMRFRLPGKSNELAIIVDTLMSP
jgi:hypothetical protein